LPGSVGGAGLNRSAQPLAGGFGGFGGGQGGGGSVRGRLLGGGGQGGGNTNVFGQEMGPDFLNNLFSQNASGANGMDFSILGNAGLAGVFDPMGSGPLLEAIRQQGISGAGANEQAARTRAMLDAGNDPSMQAAAGLQSRLGSQNQLSQMLMQARLASVLQNQGALQNFGFGLMNGERGLQQQIHGQRIGNDIQQGNGGGFMDVLGSILGIGAGSFAGGLGGGVAKQITGGK
jgi:hypothetical protein